MKQAFYHYTKWEDFQSGMYNPPCVASIESGVSSDERMLKVVELFSDKELCYKYMKRVVDEWKIAAEQNLTNPQVNGRAWLGQCACFLYAEVHDEETRKAWCLMDRDIQIQANQIAEKVIYDWRQEYSKTQDNYQMNIFDFMKGE